MTKLVQQCSLCEHDLHYGEGAYLCDSCTKATTERLERMPRLYEALAAFLAPGARGQEPGSSPAAEAPLPLSEPVLNLRGPGGIVGVLEDWRAAMQKDRGWGQPAIAGDTAKRVAAAARGLVLNLDWIAVEWPQAGQFALEIRDLHGACASIIGPPESSRRLGYCPQPVDGGPCGAVVRLPDGARTALCQWCGTEWGPTTWGQLAAGQAQFEMETA